MPSPLWQARIGEPYSSLVAPEERTAFIKAAVAEKCKRDFDKNGKPKPKKPAETEPIKVKRVVGRKVVEETVQAPATAFKEGHCPHRFASVCEDCEKAAAKGGKK